MFNFIFYNKKNLFLLLGLIGIIFILAIIAMFSTPAGEPQNEPIPIFSPSPGSSGFTPLLPLPSRSPTPEDAIPYEIENLKTDYERIVSPQPLSTPDLDIRASLINRLNNQSGVLSKTAEYQIEYVKAPNSFMVELYSADPNSAKLAATNWFKQQGLTTPGICNLPVVFYLSSQTRNYLTQTGQKFNPEPEGCQ